MSNGYLDLLRIIHEVRCIADSVKYSLIPHDIKKFPRLTLIIN